MRLLVFLLGLLSSPAFAGQVNPPPPIAAPLCGGGNSVLGYTAAGTALVCGTALATGSIANGAVGQIGVYGGLNALTPLANLTDSVLVRSGAASPAFSTTLPAGLAIPGYSLLASPVFTGDPQAPTPPPADNDTSIATTAYVQIQGYAVGSRSISTTPPLTGGGDLTTNRTLAMTGPANLTTFNASVIPKGAGTSPFTVSSLTDAGAGVTVGFPTGGSQGAGTVNATGLFINGVAVGAAGGTITGLVAQQLGIAGSPTSLVSSIDYGTTGIGKILELDGTGHVDPSVIPATGVTAGNCTNCNLTITADGRITGQGNGTGGGSAPGGVAYAVQYNNSGTLGGIGPGTPTTVLHGNDVGPPSYGPVANGELENSSLTIGSTGVALGSTASTISGLALVSPIISGGTVDGAAVGTTTPAAGTFTILRATGNTTTNITGSTQCVHANASGLLSGAGIDCASIAGLTPNQLGVAGTANSLTSSVQYGNSGASTILQTDAGGKISASTIPNTAVVAGSCTSCNLTIGPDGRITVQQNGSLPGLNQLIGDVQAGPVSQTATVTGLQGRTVSPAMPSDQNILAWSQPNLRWEPTSTPFNAINQLTGDASAGPGNGSQPLTLTTVNANPGTFAVANYDAKGRAIATGNLVGDVMSSGANATLVNTGVIAGSYNVTGSAGAPFCWAVDAKGRITGVTAGVCSGLVLALGTGTHVALGTGTLTALRTQ